MTGGEASRLAARPESVMRQLVRVFIDDGTFCPGFQFLPGGQLRPTGVGLFQRAMELQIPHNYFHRLDGHASGSAGFRPR